MNRKILIKHFLMASFLIAFGLHSFAQSNKLEAGIKEVMKEFEVVGLSVAVVKKGKIIYNNSFGLKDIATNTPMTNNTLFRIASISKSFSATSIMQLVEAGKISLDDDFGKLVGFPIRNPKFPNTVITLRMVMSHTSSINDSQGYFNLDVINPGKGANWEKCYSDYEPGKGYRYCNLNYNMVGAVIEKVSGERFDRYVKQHILNPLKLYGGYWIDSLDAGRFATLYSYDSTKKFIPSPMAYAAKREEIKNYQMGYSTPVFSPTGGMKISAADLAKYMTMHMNKGKYKGVRIISKKSANTMQTKVSDEESYGLALHTSDKLIPGKVMIGHTGSAYGLYSAMFFNPNEKFGIVVITNGCKPVYKDDFILAISKTVNVLYNNLLQ